jgi:hypothetical protein
MYLPLAFYHSTTPAKKKNAETDGATKSFTITAA